MEPTTPVNVAFVLSTKPIRDADAVVRRLKHSHEGVPTGLYYTQKHGPEAYIFTNTHGWWNIHPGSLLDVHGVDEEYRCPMHDIVIAFKPCPLCERDSKIEVKDFMLEGNNDNGIDPKGPIGATKPPLALLPPAFNEETAKALHLGITKGYGPWNWRLTKVEMMTYMHAMRRHMDAVIERIDIDPESGAHHLGHVAANCAIILDALKHGTLVDNRPPQPKNTP